MTNDLKNSSNSQSNIEKQKVQPDAKKRSEKAQPEVQSEEGRNINLSWGGVKKSIRQFLEKFKKPAQPDEQVQEDPDKRVKIRLIPIWLRIIIVLVLLLLAVVFGAMFGYAVIGEGDVSDTFNPDTWKHIFDIMNGVE